MKYITILLFFVACSVQAQTTGFDVKEKDGKLFVFKDGKQFSDTPVTPDGLAKQYTETEATLKVLAERRAQVAELLRLDEQIAVLTEQKDFVADLFNKAKAVEKSIAEAKPEPPKHEPSETTAKQ